MYIDLHDWRSTNVHECTEESVYPGCTCAHTCHVYIYRRQQYCTHGIWNANIFYKKSNKMLYPYREGTVHYSCYMRFGATLMCGTISVHVTLVVLFVFIKANGEELGLQTVFE